MLAFGEYRQLNMNGIKAVEDTDPANPKGFPKEGFQKPGGGIAMPGVKKGRPMEQPNPMAVGGDTTKVSFRQRDWKEFAEKYADMVARFAGKYAVFEPYGLLYDPTNGEKQPGMKPMFPPPGQFGPGQFGKPPRGEQSGATTTPVEISDLLVRFIDLDVQVGRTYVYAVQVRMENPNFGKKNEVAYEELAKNRELPPSPWAMIPKTVTIPGESFFYAADMDLKSLESKIPNGPGGIDIKPIPGNDQKDKMAVQLQRWVDATEEGKVIGDWAIAERVVVRRGEYIGRPRFFV
jgi:hypothetical protein